MSFKRIGLLVSPWLVHSTSSQYDDLLSGRAACRYDTDVSLRCAQPCPKFDNINLIVPTPSDGETLCETICDARMECTGYEYGKSTTRCEIWKETIQGAVGINDHVCRNYTGPEKMKDVDIYVQWTISMTGIDVGRLYTAKPSIKADFAAGIKMAVHAVMTGLPDEPGGTAAGVRNISQADIVPLESGLAWKVHVKPSADVNPLSVYQALRGGSSSDQLPDAATPIIAALTSAVSNMQDVNTYITTSLNIDMTDFVFLWSEPLPATTAAPTTAAPTAAVGGNQTTGAPNPVGGNQTTKAPGGTTKAGSNSASSNSQSASHAFRAGGEAIVIFPVVMFALAAF